MESTRMTLVGELADRSQWTTEDCSIDGSMRVLGTRSAMLIMREAHYGTTRYDDFVHRVGITEAVAAARLRELVAAGLLERRPYQEPGQRTRHEYVLTSAGVDFQPVLVALMQWGDRHLPRPSEPPLRLDHADCGEPLALRLACAAGHEVKPEEVTVRSTRR